MVKAEVCRKVLARNRETARNRRNRPTSVDSHIKRLGHVRTMTASSKRPIEGTCRKLDTPIGRCNEELFDDEGQRRYVSNRGLTPNNR